MTDDKKQMPRISVITSVFNGQAFLNEAVQSVLGQTFADFELLIYDDGSTDASGRMLAEFARRDPRVRHITQENTGLTRTLNRGLHEATGEYVARMDADDICYPERFAEQVDFLDANPGVVLLGTGYRYVDGAGRPIRSFVAHADDGELQAQSLAGRTPVCHPTAMFRREAAVRLGGYDEQYRTAQDLDLWLRLGEVGEMAILPSVLLDYRQHDGSVSERRQREQMANIAQICRSAYERRGLHRTFDLAEDWRPTCTASKYRQLAMFGWWAFQEGYSSTARAYGLKLIRRKPTRAEGWIMLAKSVLPARTQSPPLDTLADKPVPQKSADLTM